MDIKEIDLKNIDFNDSFFDSLREDYQDFNNWFRKKQRENKKAYVTYKNNKISSFLLLKIEDESETYNFNFPPKKRLKISTFKVDDINQGIGTKFINIINNKAQKENVTEIYITIYPKHHELISFLEKNQFKYYTKKDEELVYLKNKS